MKAAKGLALSEGKSVEILSQTLDYRRAAGQGTEDYRMLKWLQAGPLEPPGQKLAEIRLCVPCIPNDKFCGMVSIRFPSLMAPHSAESGLWRLGCEKVARDHYKRDEPYEIESRIVALERDTRTPLRVMEGIARSEADFFDHVAQCEGAKELVPDLEEKLKEITHA